MIDPNRDQKISDCGITPYTDPHFCDKENLLALAGRMAAGGMLRAVPEVHGMMPIFTVTKFAEFLGADVKISLRLIFDVRLENDGWRDAPWCGLGGVSSLSFLDVSEKLRQDSPLLYAVGDVPAYFYMLEIPEALSQHFVLEGLDTDELRRVFGTGQAVGCRVLPMGFKWSVFLAQTVLEDIFEQGGSDVPELGVDRRVMEGAPMPQISREAPTAYVLHLHRRFRNLRHRRRSGRCRSPGPKGQALGPTAASDHGLCSAQGRLRHCTADDWGRFRWPQACPEPRQVVGHHRSRAGHMQGTALQTGHHRVPARSVHLVLSHLEACTFAVQHHLRLAPAHARVRAQHRGTSRSAEGAGLSAIGPLVRADLAARWHPEVFMYDASHLGGGVVATTATVEEQRSEARWATRAGWCVWIGGGYFELGIEDDRLVLGDKVRAPAVGPMWDDTSRWRELFRWRWQHEEHINVLEMRTGLASVRRAVRDPASWGRRILCIGDNLVTLRAFSKGRSSSQPVLHLCRRMCALVLAFGIRLYWR